VQNSALGLATGISPNLITRVELSMKPGYNARGNQIQMGMPRTESRAERNPSRSGSCGPSQHFEALPSLTVIAARVACLSIAGSFGLWLQATFTPFVLVVNFAGG
jgi:hypothetical protein